MFEVLIKVIPLNLASTLSPGLFAMSLVLLGSKKYSKSRTLALFIGGALVAVVTIFLGYTLAQATTEITDTSKLLKATVDLILGGVFLIFGIKTLVSKERITKPKAALEPKLLQWFLIGIFFCATNLDAVIFSFTAAHEVSGATEINDIFKLILLLVNLLFITLPIYLPLLFGIFAPGPASRILPKINQVVLTYSKYIIFAIFVIFGIILLWRGINFFW